MSLRPRIIADRDRDLLGGARRKRTRVRGFAPWSPEATTLKLLDQVKAVLGEYEDYLPLTIRQIFYRLVGAHEYEKTEQSYKNLCEYLNRARRAKIIDMDDIRDDGITTSEPDGWNSVAQFRRTVRNMADNFTLDHSAGQTTRLVVTCEAAGMVPQLERVAHPFGVTVISGGGFESTTSKYSFAKSLTEEDRPTQVFDIGDHDASGAHRYLAYTEDVKAFAKELGGEVDFTRLVVTPTQITRYRLPTAPKKATDKRAFIGETCQAEAMAPDLLASILRSAIKQYIKQSVLDDVLEQEADERRKLVRQIKAMG
jgi:hypothetical protein